MVKLLPDQLRELWEAVDQRRLTAEVVSREQERLLGEYRNTWKQALLLGGHQDLQESILSELAVYTRIEDLSEIRRRCGHAVAKMKGEWQARVIPGDRQSIEQYYDETETTIYELMWWHTLEEDASPLAYVFGLRVRQAVRLPVLFGLWSRCGLGRNPLRPPRLRCGARRYQLDDASLQ